MIERKLLEWEEAAEDLHAPSLFRYEVASGLTRSIVAGAIDVADAETSWRRIMAIPITLHGLDDGPAVIALARQLQRESAYDAAYVVLAQELEADMWTIDGPLARNAAGKGLPVQLIDTA